MKQASVSVVVCTYNGEKFIREQLDSILNQTATISEIIIQDDNSTDSTWQILSEYSSKYSVIKIFQNKKNIGCDENFFSALAKATSEYIAISDQDDIWDINKIKLQLNDLIKHPDCLLSAHETLPFTNAKPQKPYPIIKNREAVSLEKMIIASGYAGHTMLLRKQLIDTILHALSLDIRIQLEDLLYYDQILLICALSIGNIRFIPEYLTLHRRIDSSITTGTVPYKGIKNTIKLFIQGIHNSHNSIIQNIISKRFQLQSMIIETLQDESSKTQTALQICEHYQKPTIVSSIRLLIFLSKQGQSWGGGIKGTLRSIFGFFMIYSILFSKERKQFILLSSKK